MACGVGGSAAISPLLGHRSPSDVDYVKVPVSRARGQVVACGSLPYGHDLTFSNRYRNFPEITFVGSSKYGGMPVVNQELELARKIYSDRLKDRSDFFFNLNSICESVDTSLVRRLFFAARKIPEELRAIGLVARGRRSGIPGPEFLIDPSLWTVLQITMSSALGKLILKFPSLDRRVGRKVATLLWSRLKSVGAQELAQLLSHQMGLRNFELSLKLLSLHKSKCSLEVCHCRASSTYQSLDRELAEYLILESTKFRYRGTDIPNRSRPTLVGQRVVSNPYLILLSQLRGLERLEVNLLGCSTPEFAVERIESPHVQSAAIPFIIWSPALGAATTIRRTLDGIGKVTDEKIIDVVTKPRYLHLIRQIYEACDVFDFRVAEKMNLLKDEEPRIGVIWVSFESLAGEFRLESGELVFPAIVAAKGAARGSAIPVMSSYRFDNAIHAPDNLEQAFRLSAFLHRV